MSADMFISDYEKLEKQIKFQEISQALGTEINDENVQNLSGITQPPFQGRHSPTKIICFYAEKGGVGKTSNICSIAYMLSEKCRVLVYDCDSQRSLSGFLLGLNYQSLVANQDIENPLDEYINRYTRENEPISLYDQIILNDIKATSAFAFFIKKNLWLVAGNRKTSSLDSEINQAEILTNPNFPFASPNNKSGKPYAAIMETAKKYKADYVLLDLNPSNGILNRCLVMSSHYLIVSSISDFHCAETMFAMFQMLKEWLEKMNKLREIEKLEPARKSYFPIPERTVKFLGYIVNRVDSNCIGPIINGLEDNSKGYRSVEKCWLERLEKAADRLTSLSNPEISNPSIAVSHTVYLNLERRNKVGEVREYWSFKNISDIVHLPVPCLQKRHMIQYNKDSETIFRNYKLPYDKILRFRQVFEEICKTIVKIIQEDESLQLNNIPI